jgi:CheY-like chemotaxis protein
LEERRKRRREGEMTGFVIPDQAEALQRPVVLVVDDSDDNRDMCAQCLVLEGFRVLQAATAGEALRLASRADAVLMDLALPGMGGLEAARILRTDPRTADVPLVALTGFALEDMGPLALGAGFDRVLGKPCLPDAIASAVREAIEVHLPGSAANG